MLNNALEISFESFVSFFFYNVYGVYPTPTLNSLHPFFMISAPLPWIVLHPLTFPPCCQWSLISWYPLLFERFNQYHSCHFFSCFSLYFLFVYQLESLSLIFSSTYLLVNSSAFLRWIMCPWHDASVWCHTLIAITPKPTQTRVVIPVRVSFMGQIGLFENYLY